MTYDDARELLQEYGQEDVFRFWDRLDGGERSALLAQIAGIDFESVGQMRRLLEDPQAVGGPGPEEIEPAVILNLEGTEADRAVAEGRAALRGGKVGAILVAGGQGSRLGFDGPKGCYPIGPVSGASLFRIHARKILALEREFETRIPFYVMTSSSNDEATRAFFRDNGWFGLSPERVLFFVQGMWPALGSDGRLVLDSPGHIFVSPDGHGGLLSALKNEGMLSDMRTRGVETLFYFQVDNPLIDIADPAFIGAHRLGNCDISLKVCAKREPDEGLGTVAKRGVRNVVVEYTELTDEQRHARLPGGRLKFGSAMPSSLKSSSLTRCRSRIAFLTWPFGAKTNSPRLRTRPATTRPKPRDWQ